MSEKKVIGWGSCGGQAFPILEGFIVMDEIEVEALREKLKEAAEMAEKLAREHKLAQEKILLLEMALASAAQMADRAEWMRAQVAVVSDSHKLAEFDKFHEVFLGRLTKALNGPQSGKD